MGSLFDGNCWLGFQVAFVGGYCKAHCKLKSLALRKCHSLRHGLTNELAAIHHLKRFCYTTHVFTSWSAEKENGRLFCTAKVCVSKTAAQVGTHSFSDVEHFKRIRRMSNNVKLSSYTAISLRGQWKKGGNVTLDCKISYPHILYCWHDVLCI